MLADHIVDNEIVVCYISTVMSREISHPSDITAPESQLSYSGVQQALDSVARLHTFRSGGGLRVVRLERDGTLVGYGEHPNIEDAMSHADEDYLAGGRKYKQVYGKIYPHYLTGSSHASSILDSWISRGFTVDAVRNDEGRTELSVAGLSRDLKDIRFMVEGENLGDAIGRVNQTTEFFSGTV